MKRPWKERIWFYKPDAWFHDWRLIWFGDDEYHWKTLVLGFPWTGQVVVALWPFPMPCECNIEGYPGYPMEVNEWLELSGLAEWSNALVSKASVPEGTEGSNPSPAAPQ